jgi:hypothetical protein
MTAVLGGIALPPEGRAAVLDEPTRSDLRAHAYRLARERLAHARAESAPPSRVHRALVQGRLLPWTLLQAVVIAGALMSLVWWLQDPLVLWWHHVILFWAGHLGIPLAASSASAGLLSWLPQVAATTAPSPALAAGMAAVVLALYAGSYWMRDEMTPLKYLLRTLCVLQATAIAFFVVVPSLFPYSVPRHVQAMLGAGYILMLASPALLAGGYALLRIPAWQRLAHPLLVLAYFVVLVPHQAVLHAWMLQHFSVLLMPLLYLAFGVVFDMMIFVALYSWLASHVAPRAVA